jgi:hypothetical protein
MRNRVLGRRTLLRARDGGGALALLERDGARPSNGQAGAEAAETGLHRGSRVAEGRARLRAKDARSSWYVGRSRPAFAPGGNEPAGVGQAVTARRQARTALLGWLLSSRQGGLQGCDLSAQLSDGRLHTESGRSRSARISSTDGLKGAHSGGQQRASSARSTDGLRTELDTIAEQADVAANAPEVELMRIEPTASRVRFWRSPS